MNTPFIFNPSTFHRLHSFSSLICPPCNSLSHGLIFQGWRHKPKPSPQRNGQVLHETYFHITIAAVKILIMIMSESMISSGFYEDDNDHSHPSTLIIIFIVITIILHRSELQSLANQTAYNVSQLLDNLLQVTIFQPCSDVLLDYIP